MMMVYRSIQSYLPIQFVVYMKIRNAQGHAASWLLCSSACYELRRIYEQRFEGTLVQNYVSYLLSHTIILAGLDEKCLILELINYFPYISIKELYFSLFH